MEDERQGSIGDRIVRASLAVGMAHVAFKLVGLIQAIVAGRYLDNTTFDTVYVFAFEGVVVSLFLIGEEVIGPAFLPIFMRELDLRGERNAWALANVVLALQSIVLLITICLVMCFPDAVIHLLTYWTSDQDTYALARRSVVWLAPSLFCLSIGSTTYMLLNGYKRFFLAAFGDASWKLCVLVSLVAGIGIFHLDYRALVFGLLIGSVAKLLTHLLGLLGKLHHLRLTLSLSNPALRNLGLLMLPLIGGIVFAKFRDIYNNVTILSYLDTEGLMKANSFGRKLFLAISWFVPYAVSIAMFPFFCELVDRDNRQKLGEILTHAGRMMLAVFIPGALLIAILSQPLAAVLFRGGKFTAETVYWAGLSNSCYILVLPAFALEYILMQGYFANRKMLSVLSIGISFSLLSVGISYVCIVHYGLRGVDALVAVALGYTISRTFKTMVLIGILKRSVPMFPVASTVGFLVRTTAVGLLVAGAGFGVLRGFEHWISASEGKIVLTAKLLCAGIPGTLVYIVGMRAARIREPFEMLVWALAKVRQKLARAQGRD